MSEGPVEPVGTEPIASDNAPEAVVEPPVVTENPAWQGILDSLPTSLHDTVKPHLKEWDQNIGRKLQESAERYNPYNQFVEAQVPADELVQAWELMQRLNTDPRGLWDQMGQYFEFNAAGEVVPVAPNAEPAPSGGLPGDLDPEFASYVQNLENQLAQQGTLMEQIATYIIDGEQSKESAAADNELVSELGTYADNPLVLSLVANEVNIKDAIRMYEESVTTAAGGRPPAPTVIGGGGSLPAPPPQDLGKMTGNQTRRMVEQILRDSNGG